MTAYADWGAALSSVFSRLMERLVQHVPNLLGALALIFLGWIIAKLMRALAVRASRLLDRLFSRMLRGRGEDRQRALSASADVLGSIVFWVVILFFLAAAAQVLGLGAFADWFNRIALFLPTLFTGGLIILAGYVVSVLVRELVVATAVTLAEHQRKLIGRIAQGVILVTGIVIGADQIGIKVTFLVIIATVMLITVLGSMAAAIGLGATTYVRNLIGAHYLRQTYRTGQRVRIAGHEGTILELTATAVVIETAEGRVTVPASVFNEEPTVLVMGRDHHG